MSKKHKSTDDEEARQWRTDSALKKRACMIAYKPFKWSRGWWVREYHSTFAMKQHLKGKAGYEQSFGDTSGFETEEDARQYALGWWLGR